LIADVVIAGRSSNNATRPFEEPVGTSGTAYYSNTVSSVGGDYSDNQSYHQGGYLMTSTPQQGYVDENGYAQNEHNYYVDSGNYYHHDPNDPNQYYAEPQLPDVPHN
jgi:hypothetical protein